MGQRASNRQIGACSWVEFARLQLGIECKQPAPTFYPRSAPEPIAIEEIGLTAHRLGGRGAVFALDMAVREGRHEAQVDGGDGLFGRQSGSARLPQARHADFEDILEISDVLPCNAVTLGGNRHRLSERDAGCLRDILLRGLAEPARRSQPDGHISLLGIGTVERVEHARDPLAQGAVLWTPYTCEERCGEKDDAEIGIEAHGRAGSLDGPEDALSNPQSWRGDD